MSHVSGGLPEPAYRTIVRLPTFESSMRGLLAEDEQRHLEYRLAVHPRAGPVVPGTAAFGNSGWRRPVGASVEASG